MTPKPPEHLGEGVKWHPPVALRVQVLLLLKQWEIVRPRFAR
jgi:hypothetical protein